MRLVQALTTKSGGSSDNLSELVFQKIKNDIFDFQLKPGQHFTESEIAETYAVSRTPIRQALYRLQQEGYVDVRFRRGWQICPLNFKRYEELYDLRILLESYAIEQLCQMPEEQLNHVLADLIQIWCIEPDSYLSDLQQLAMQDEDFHCQLVIAAANTEMTKIHREISEKIRIIRRLDFSKINRIEATYIEHQKILNLILSKNLKASTTALTSHIVQSRNEVKKITLEMLASSTA